MSNFVDEVDVASGKYFYVHKLFASNTKKGLFQIHVVSIVVDARGKKVLIMIL